MVLSTHSTHRSAFCSIGRSRKHGSSGVATSITPSACTAWPTKNEPFLAGASFWSSISRLPCTMNWTACVVCRGCGRCSTWARVGSAPGTKSRSRFAGAEAEQEEEGEESAGVASFTAGAGGEATKRTREAMLRSVRIGARSGGVAGGFGPEGCLGGGGLLLAGDQGGSGLCAGD